MKYGLALVLVCICTQALGLDDKSTVLDWRTATNYQRESTIDLLVSAAKKKMSLDAFDFRDCVQYVTSQPGLLDIPMRSVFVQCMVSQGKKSK